LYLPPLAQDSTNKSLVLGTASNHAKHPKPRTVDLEAFRKISRKIHLGGKLKLSASYKLSRRVKLPPRR
jgi:hypothetical protein